MSEGDYEKSKRLSDIFDDTPIMPEWLLMQMLRSWRRGFQIPRDGHMTSGLKVRKMRLHRKRGT